MGVEMEIKLAPAECTIMQCLWESGEDLTAYELRERLKAEYGKEYSLKAMAAFMNLLLKKGAVSRYKEHHSYQYHSEICMDAYRQEQVKEFGEQWYHGSAVDMLASIVENQVLDEKEREKLWRLMEKYGTDRTDNR